MHKCYPHHYYQRMETVCPQNSVFSFCIFKPLTLDEVQEHNGAKCIKPLPEPYRIEYYLHLCLKSLFPLSLGSCWHLLRLTYKVSWPLHLLFDSVALDNYNKLFCFLLCVKKTQLDLHNVWRKHMECKTQR